MSWNVRPLRLTPLLLCLVLQLSPATPGRDAASSWDVKMTIEVRGDYRIEAPGVKVAGTYVFVVRWTGTMEKDDEDYLLVHNSCDLTKWEIEEKADAEGALRVLTTGDFPDKPALKVNYILKLEDGLHVDFAVEGFDVPRAIATEGFELIFPATKENIARFGGLNYGLFVKTGSNKIVMDESAILRGSADKTFDWTWKHQAWVQKQERTIFQSNAHQAKVKIEITLR